MDFKARVTARSNISTPFYYRFIVYSFTVTRHVYFLIFRFRKFFGGGGITVINY